MTGRSLVILSLFPELSNVHGDAQNAAVLAARARWAGHEVRTVELPLGGSLNDALSGVSPHVVVVGAGFDDDAPRLLDGLTQVRSALLDWHARGTPILAVASGWELLSRQVEFKRDEPITGIGLFPGRAVPTSNPRAGQLVVETEFGSLVGYEYQSRNYISAVGESPFGRVVAGQGNGADSGHEGSRIGNTFGTHLRGPVLARNPAFADGLLALAEGFLAPDRAAEPREAHDAVSDPLSREAADALAETVNRRIRSAL